MTLARPMAGDHPQGTLGNGTLDGVENVGDCCLWATSETVPRRCPRTYQETEAKNMEKNNINITIVGERYLWTAIYQGLGAKLVTPYIE